jgi:hypothetical protein
MKTSLLLAGAALTALSMAACKPLRRTELVLPPGDSERGRAAFIALKCHECHTVEGVTDLPAPTTTTPIHLGGEVDRLRSYDRLVTAIIHPDIKREVQPPAGATAMPVVNDKMTVTQMVDLTTFLLPRYRLRPLPTYVPLDPWMP